MFLQRHQVKLWQQYCWNYWILELCILIEYTYSVAKSILKTIRFSPEEWRRVKGYLRQNPALGTVSGLGRIAVLELIRTRDALPLRPLKEAGSGERPSFLWDYDLTEDQVRELLWHAPMDQKKWLIARILERSPLQEVLRYLTVEQIRQALPRVRIDPKGKRHWQEAVELWTHPTPPPKS